MTLAAPIPALQVAGVPALQVPGVPALQVAGVPASVPTGPTTPGRMADTAARVYDAEVNLHHARQSGIDAWISAAYDHLHLALGAHAEACGLAGGHGPSVDGSGHPITS